MMDVAECEWAGGSTNRLMVRSSGCPITCDSLIILLLYNLLLTLRGWRYLRSAAFGTRRWITRSLRIASLFVRSKGESAGQEQEFY
jgi:hypothetical protein